MMYQLKYTKKYDKQFSKLDYQTQKMIFNWVNKNLYDTKNPRQHGKGLKGNLSNRWRYRIGSYRIIVEIEDTELIILALEVGHRSKIYENL